MGRVAEMLYEELSEVARLTGEQDVEVEMQYFKANRDGVGLNEFITSKSKKTKK